MGADAIGLHGSTPPPSAGACVVLRHDLPDGSWHYDLLLELRPGTRDDRRLAALRLMPASGPHTITIAPGIEIDHEHDERSTGCRCTRLPDHRGLYLTFEGSLTGGRGRVRRVAQGACLVKRCNAEIILSRIDLGEGWRSLHARRVHADAAAAQNRGRESEYDMLVTLDTAPG